MWSQLLIVIATFLLFAYIIYEIALIAKRFKNIQPEERTALYRYSGTRFMLFGIMLLCWSLILSVFVR